MRHGRALLDKAQVFAIGNRERLHTKRRNIQMQFIKLVVPTKHGLAREIMTRLTQNGRTLRHIAPWTFPRSGRKRDMRLLRRREFAIVRKIMKHVGQRFNA